LPRAAGCLSRRHGGAEIENREWTLIHANEFDGAAWRGTAKNAKIANVGVSGWTSVPIKSEFKRGFRMCASR